MAKKKVNKPVVSIDPPDIVQTSYGAIDFGKRDRINFTICEYRTGGIYVDFDDATEYFSPVDNINLEEYGFDEEDSDDAVKAFILRSYTPRYSNNDIKDAIKDYIGE